MSKSMKSTIEAIKKESQRASGRPMSRAALAKTLNVSVSAVANWESGKSRPSEGNLAKLSGLLVRLTANESNGVGVNGTGAKRHERSASVAVLDDDSEVDDSEADDSEVVGREHAPGIEPFIDVSTHYAIGCPKAPILKPSDAVVKEIGARIKNNLRILKIKPTSSLSVEFRDTSDGVKAICVFFSTLSPETMKHLLLDGHHNRDASLGHSRTLGNDMRRGYYEFTGEPVIIDEDNRLSDGQHRLRSAYSLGKPLHAIVVMGVSRTAFRVINGIKARTVRDRMVCAGRSFSATRTALLRILGRLDKTLEDDSGLDMIDNSGAVQFHGPSAFSLEQHYANEMDLEQAILFVNGLRWTINSKRLPRHIGALFYLFAAKQSQPAAANFLRFLADGGAPQASPILACRDRMENLPKGRQRTSEQIKLLCLAWNAYCEDRKSDGRLLDKKKVSSSRRLTCGLSAPTAAVEARAASETPGALFSAIIERAKASCERGSVRRRERMNDIDGFADSLRRGYEVT